MQRIPVTLPDGRRFELTPGGQNVLVREIVEETASVFLVRTRGANNAAGKSALSESQTGQATCS